MTRDEVVDLVAAVDFEFMGKQNWNAFDKYEAFANLVAAHEREACAKVCEAQREYGWQQYAEAIRARGEQA